MERSEQINELAAALAKAQGEMENATKDSENPFFKSMYADLAAVWRAIRGPLAKNGLAVIQTTQLTGPVMVLETVLAHSSGQWISGDFLISPAKPDMQGIGAATTYARRFALQSIVGLAAEDDDGNVASGLSVPPVNVKPVSGLVTPKCVPTSAGLLLGSFHSASESASDMACAQVMVVPPTNQPCSVAALAHDREPIFCQLCRAQLILKKDGKGYYCPTFFKDKKGGHSKVKIEDVAAFKIADSNARANVIEGEPFL